jgi:hypothetical protein
VTVSLSGCPCELATARSRSSQKAIGCPSIAVTTSSAFSSAAAGPSGVTRPTTAGHTGRPTVARMMLKMIAARTKFIPGPANTIRNRAHSGLSANALSGSKVAEPPPSSGLSSPTIFT